MKVEKFNQAVLFRMCKKISWQGAGRFLMCPTKQSSFTKGYFPLSANIPKVWAIMSSWKGIHC